MSAWIRSFLTGSRAWLDNSGSLLILAGCLALLVLILLVLLWRATRQNRDGNKAETAWREDLGRLNIEVSRQLDQLQNNLAGRVAESNRDQREVNALFMSQLQQYGQGNGQMLENVRRSVSENLNKVAGSLQEMQAVTSEVKSLKQILGNVKTRGIIGELQLEQLLADVLPPGQFEQQLRIRPEKQEAVDFAIKISSGQSAEETVLLPVDAKFPMDSFARLMAALDAVDLESAEVFRKELTARIRQEARKIALLYLMPPRTTDFAILYLPTESLFAEVVRDADLTAEVYRQHRVIIAGPSSMTAILAGLQATFRLQSLEQKSLLIAQRLVELQRDFGLYEAGLERVRNRLVRALNEVEDTGRKASLVRRRLDGLDLAEYVGPAAMEEISDE